MKLLLVFLLAMVVVGLVTDRLDWKIYGITLAAATMTAALFLTFGRFWL